MVQNCSISYNISQGKYKQIKKVVSQKIYVSTMPYVYSAWKADA